MDMFNLPDKKVIVDIVEKLMQIIYPGYFRDKSFKIYNANNNLSMLIEDVLFHLNKQIAIALKYRQEEGKTREEIGEESQRIAIAFFEKIPHIREYVDTDLQAAFDGDPAACYKDEIIFSYPGLYAITVNRIAHELYQLSVPMIPRIMTEYAHGVTLGALSTRGGQKLKSVKRHPTIEDNVTIYAGASILGGDTVIGKNSVIGSNAFITKSIQPGTRVSIKNQELQFKYGKKDILQKNDLEQDELWYNSI